ncbi:uncharacterized protein LOC117167383 [Belonocnema kinseyi]|uniref:uncharacterized protein LOC117167383 n=1 Tax=Belonocnema kinseyi TaxID=2817044 RepID=UPI00143DDA7F|nr:uncharacterized protein LOC117167383 [Belonocnema kinseyi]
MPLQDIKKMSGTTFNRNVLSTNKYLQSTRNSLKDKENRHISSHTKRLAKDSDERSFYKSKASDKTCFSKMGNHNPGVPSKNNINNDLVKKSSSYGEKGRKDKPNEEKPHFQRTDPKPDNHEPGVQSKNNINNDLITTILEFHLRLISTMT